MQNKSIKPKYKNSPKNKLYFIIINIIKSKNIIITYLHVDYNETKLKY